MKKNFYKKLAVAAMGTLLVFACAGCSKKEADKENEAVAVVNNMQHASASTDGALLFKDGVVYYSDVKKGVSTPLCTKANCPHTSARECTANYGKGSGDGMCAFFYEKKLYVLVNDELTNSKLYVADQNGQNRKEIGKLDYSVSANARLIVKDGMAAAVLEKNQSDENTGEVTSMPVLVTIDLTSGTATELVEPLNQYRAQISLHSVNDNTVYYSYSYWDEKKEVVDKCGDPATTVEEMKELMKTNAHTFAGFLSTDGNQGKENELEAADAPNVVYMDEDNVYLTKGTENSLYKMTFETMEAEKEASWESDMNFIDGMMVYGDRASEKTKFHAVNFKDDGKTSEFEAPSDSLFTAVIGEDLYYTYMPEVNEEGEGTTELGVAHLK